MTSLVLSEVRADGVALLKLNNPPMNALSIRLLNELATAARQLAADANVKAVVLLGAERAFAAGADISDFDRPNPGIAVSEAFRSALDAITAIPRPVIAAVNGYALGGGCELALAADLRIVGASAKFGQPEILLGIIPGAGGTQRLSRIVGVAKAKELIFTGRQVAAEEALAIGLANRVVPNSELETEAINWAASLAAGAVAAMGAAKQAIDDGFDLPLPEALDLEARAFVGIFETEDAAIGVKSFQENGPGKAAFVGR